MSHINDFHKFLRDRRIAVDDISEFADLIEPLVIDEQLGYRLKSLDSPDKISQRCQSLLFYTWHCRDYVKKVLVETVSGCSKEKAGQIVNDCMSASIHAQVVSYLSNSYKHDGTDASQKWAVDLAPRLGKPYVLGQQLSFPLQLKPTLIITGDKLADLEFVGRAGVGDEIQDFDDFTWKHSCQIENKDGEVIGDVVTFCETTFSHWLRILRENGVVALSYPVYIPRTIDNRPELVEISGVASLVLFTNQDLLKRYHVERHNPVEFKLDIPVWTFNAMESLATFLEENGPRFTELGYHQIAVDIEPNCAASYFSLSQFVEFLKNGS